MVVMMVGTGSVSRSAGSLVDMMREKDDDGRFASGERNSEDGRLSCGETHQGTNSQFLYSEEDIYWDDSSTASTAVLIDNHLYVANVEDYRTIISKAGKAIALCEDHKPNRSDERKRN
ncbi:putative protein phosphatase 2C [Arachis hypogaea]|nr:putative protein phosphatase 2C [Arachis hypogaea]